MNKKMIGIFVCTLMITTVFFTTANAEIILDQSCESGNSSMSLDNNYNIFAQSFEPTIDNIVKVGTKVSRSEGITVIDGLQYIAIRSSLDGSNLRIGGSPLYYVSTSPQWRYLDFSDDPLSVTPGETYFIVRWISSEDLGDENFYWHGDTSDPYPDGMAHIYFNDDWHDFSYFDFNFRVYGDLDQNNPPEEPSNPNPSNGAPNVGINADLSWTCSDPDGDPLTYDVYFEEGDSDPELVSEDQTETTYDPGTLDYNDLYYWKIVAKDDQGATTTGPVWDFTTTSEPNDPPNKPSKPYTDNGIYAGNENEEFTFKTDTEDPEDDDVFYKFDWGDGTTSGWLGPYYSGGTVEKTHAWTKEGIYEVKAKAKDIHENQGEWSDKSKVTINAVKPFSFVHITDPHVIGVGSGADNWADVIEEIKSLPDQPGFVLCSGDLVDWGADNLFSNPPDFSGTQNYNIFKQKIHKKQVLGNQWPWFIDDEYEIPIFFCPGNHDARQKGDWQVVNPFKSIDNYKQYIHNSEDYTIDHTDPLSKDNYAIFSLFSGYDLLPWGGFLPIYPYNLPWGNIFLPEGDGLRSFQIDNLENWANTNSNSFKIIMMHHPLNNDLPGYNLKDGAFWNYRNEFKQVCINNDIDLVVYGHIHPNEGSFITDINGNPWVSGSSTGTMFVRTPSVKDHAAATSITVFPIKGGRGNYDIVVEDPIFCKSVINIDARCQADALAYDDKGNFVGMDEDGDVVLDIPGSHYSRWEFDYYNETPGAPPVSINKTQTEISVTRDRSTDYEFFMNSFSEDDMDLTVEVHLENGMWSKAIYENIEMTDGAIVTMNVDDGIVDYWLLVDTDGDGNPEFSHIPQRYEGNLPPEKPDSPTGPSSAKPGESCTFSTKTIDPDFDTTGNDLYYQFDWDDGSNSGWIGPYKSGEECRASNVWNEEGTYNVKVKAKDKHGAVSEWSEPLKVTMPRNRANQRLFLHFLENHPNIFLILRQLLGLY